MTICDLWMEQVELPQPFAGSPNSVMSDSGMLATKGNLACIFVLERWSEVIKDTYRMCEAKSRYYNYTTVDAPPLR